MTIKWGDPIECNGVRPDWLRGRQPLSVDTDLPSGRWLYEDVGDVPAHRPVEDWAWSYSYGKPNIRRFKLPADHPAYVALARGFTPWSGGDSAPDDWDGDHAPNILLRNGSTRKSVSSWAWRENSSRAAHATDFDVIGYRKRNTEPHLARIEVEGSAPVDGVFIKRMTPAAIVERWTEALSPDGTYEDDVVEFCRRLGLVQDETLAERFTRETGHAVTEAVEAALNWKGE